MHPLLLLAEAADGGSFGGITTDGHRDVDFTSFIGRRRTGYQVEGRRREYQAELFRNLAQRAQNDRENQTDQAGFSEESGEKSACVGSILATWI